ncbi:hypothetical protein [Parabacteroides sp. PF5-9]|uniref:hypothetical protein n=1 Tax=Parabacteroides sp. PF5-9 TaxID=1742404 RepID=UPI0024772C04|nr:hypothetical protein [Parabacteroides sp. PF5-9]MDH6358696.1 hypothetical protein [Parabacteroides sp. PF5-9]
MKKIGYIVCFALMGWIFPTVLSAQITVGSDNLPDKAKLLQIEETGGLGLPRVELVNIKTLEPFISTTSTDWTTNLAKTKMKHAGLMVYNIKVQPGLRKGIYVWDGEKWTEAGLSENRRWFYMPPFNLPMDVLENKTFDLYAEYKRQFTKSGNSDFKQSGSTTYTTVPSPKIGQLYAKNQLDYAVVYFDDEVIDVTGIDDDGVMSYKVKDIDPAVTAFMTVVFIIKE